MLSNLVSSRITSFYHFIFEKTIHLTSLFLRTKKISWKHLFVFIIFSFNNFYFYSLNSFCFNDKTTEFHTKMAHKNFIIYLKLEKSVLSWMVGTAAGKALLLDVIEEAVVFDWEFWCWLRMACSSFFFREGYCSIKSLNACLNWGAMTRRRESTCWWRLLRSERLLKRSLSSTRKLTRIGM